MGWAGLSKYLPRKKTNNIDEDDQLPETKEQSGQTKLHVFMNACLQIALTIAFVFNVRHEQFPKPPDVADYPGLGDPGDDSFPKP
jgi:hypothetical protein